MDDLSLKVQEFNKLRFFNRLLLIFFTSYSVGLVIYTIINENQDSLFEYIFMFIVALASIINYFLVVLARPIRKDSLDKKKLLIEQYEDMTHKCNYAYLGYLQPIIIGDFAIIIFELGSSPYFYHFLTLLFGLGAFLIFRVEYAKHYIAKCYEEITGDKLIILFP